MLAEQSSELPTGLSLTGSAQLRLLLHFRALLSLFLCSSVHGSFSVFSLQTGYVQLRIWLAHEGVSIEIAAELSLGAIPTHCWLSSWQWP